MCFALVFNLQLHYGMFMYVPMHTAKLHPLCLQQFPGSNQCLVNQGLRAAHVHQGLVYTPLTPYWYAVYPSQIKERVCSHQDLWRKSRGKQVSASRSCCSVAVGHGGEELLQPMGRFCCGPKDLQESMGAISLSRMVVGHSWERQMCRQIASPSDLMLDYIQMLDWSCSCSYWR